MKSFIAAFVVAALVGGVLTPLVRRLALRIGAMDKPGGRHVHGQSIPRLGGLAMAAAFFAPLLGLFFVESGVAQAFTQETRKVLGLFIGGTAMCAVGFIDDTRGLRALQKLYAQVFVSVVAFACGFRIEAVFLPIIGSLPMGIFALPVTVLWIVGVVNAVNLIDGLDGLAAGVVFFAGLTNFIIAWISGNTLVSLLMASTMGAVVGFLFYNFNPARIFMGDSGSYFLGFVLAATSLMGAPKASTAVSLLVPVVALGVPIFDTLFAMVRRFLERRPIFSPDRGHIHHRLLDMGITHRRAVLIIYGVSVVFTLSAIAISLGRSWHVGVALLSASVVLVALVRFVGYFEYMHGRRRQKARIRTSDAERVRRTLTTLPARLDAAANEDEILGLLDSLRVEAQLTAVQVLQPTGAGERTAFQSGTMVAERSDDVSARYPIGPDPAARAHLKFVWESEIYEVSPQTDILLQVVTDLFELHLRRVRSDLAPADPPAVGHRAELVHATGLEARQVLPSQR